MGCNPHACQDCKKTTKVSHIMCITTLEFLFFMRLICIHIRDLLPECNWFSDAVICGAQGWMPMRKRVQILL